MKNNVKNILKGIIIAIIAAYFFPIIAFGIGGDGSTLKGVFIVMPLIGLLLTFWLVIPIGAITSILIPKIVNCYPRQIAVSYSFLIGILIGAIGNVILSIVNILPGFRDGFWREFAGGLLLMCLYSAIWTGVYAYLCKKRPA